MKFIAETSPISKHTIYTLVISDVDLMKIDIDRFTTVLLAECAKSDKVSDKLIALTEIVKKIEDLSPQDKSKEGTHE